MNIGILITTNESGSIHRQELSSSKLIHF